MAGLIMASLVFLLPEGLRPAWTIHFVNLARCFYGFSVGVLLQAVFERLGGDARAAASSDWRFTVLELLATGIAIAFITSAMFLPRHLIAPLAFAPMVLVFAYDRGGLSRWLGKPPFVLLGTLSYSIYMIHGFVQSRVMLPVAFAIDKLTGMRLISIETTSEGSRYVWGTTEAGGLLAIAAMAGLVVASSWLTYRFIEAPGRDGMRRLVTRNRPGVALVA